MGNIFSFNGFDLGRDGRSAVAVRIKFINLVQIAVHYFLTFIF
jgi:hypothetical protein